MSVENKKIFVKFIKSEYLSSFLEEGLIHMETLKYFKGVEEDQESLRGDKNEGLISTHDAKTTTVTWQGRKIPVTGSINISYSEDNKINIYCLTAITGKDISSSKNGKFYLPDQFIGFGDKAILINRADLFFERIKIAVKESNDITPFEKNVLGRQVDYFDENEHHCKLGVFAKYSNYSWQHEWRMAFERIKGEGAMELRIGNLNDIVHVIDTEKAIKHPLMLSKP